MSARTLRSARPRQADIARAAGVSQPTVSLVLNGRDAAAQVSSSTRERVLDVARRLGYQADLAARKLAGGRNLILGLYTFEPAFPIDQRDFYYPFLVGVEEEAAERGHDVLLFTSARAGGNRLLLADGCVLLGRQAPEERLRRLLLADFPFVFIGRRDIPGLSYVGADYRAATDVVVAHLHKLGHRSLAYIGELAHDPSAADREVGFREAVSRLGMNGRVWRDDAFAGPALASLLSLGITAFACESQTVDALVSAAAALGLAVPEAFSYAVLGDPVTPPAYWEESRVTHFVIPRHDMGAAAVRMLIERIEQWETASAEPVSVLLPCSFVPGSTTAPPA